MIGRVWHGWTTRENADAYERLLEREVLPGIQSRVQGYNGVHVLKRDDGDFVEFVTLTLWDSFDAIETLVGDDRELAYVPQEAREVLHHFDERAVHYDIVLQGPHAT